jgi:hypothetical protein
LKLTGSGLAVQPQRKSIVTNHYRRGCAYRRTYLTSLSIRSGKRKRPFAETRTIHPGWRAAARLHRLSAQHFASGGNPPCCGKRSVKNTVLIELDGDDNTLFISRKAGEMESLGGTVARIVILS